jgi:hypothetical protein
MAASDLPPCGCDLCQQGVDHPAREMHRQTIALLSRLDENQRRWFVAHEAQRLGYGGDRLMAQITGMDEKTIRRGHTELAALLVGQPVASMRAPGGGRPPVEKKTQRSNRP